MFEFIYNDEKSSKFWNIEIQEKSFTVVFGKTGTAGQSQTKEFASEDECTKAAAKLVAEKTKKGYREADDKNSENPFPAKVPKAKAPVKFIETEYAEDDEVTRRLRKRKKIAAPYFFSWFYDLRSFKFTNANTCIFEMGDEETDYDEEEDDDNEAEIKEDKGGIAHQKLPVFSGHSAFFVIRPEFYFSVEKNWHDDFSFRWDKMEAELAKGGSIFIDDFNPKSKNLNAEGIKLYQENDYAGAYTFYKQSADLSPNYYRSLQGVGACFAAVGAYEQAILFYEKAANLTPENLRYEVDCMEHTALCALRLGQHDKALSWAKKATDKNADVAGFAWRVAGEVYIAQKDFKQAIDCLKKSKAVQETFTANWLLGLVYHLQDDKKQSDIFYNTAKNLNEKAKPYSEHLDLAYFYGEPKKVDWEISPAKPKEKDQNYWDAWFAEKTSGSVDWEFPIETIPAEFRSRAMFETFMKKDNRNFHEFILKNFPQYLTKEILLQMAPTTWRFSDFPKQLVDKEICLKVNHYLSLSDVQIPLDYELCLHAVSLEENNFEDVPQEFRDETMMIARIAGGALDRTTIELPKKYLEAKYIAQAVQMRLHAIEKIPGYFVDKEVFAAAEAVFGQHEAWKWIVEKYDRNAWKYGKYNYDIGHMAETIQKYGMDAMAKENIAYVDKYKCNYYEKHFGHLPQFKEYFKLYGWDAKKNVVDEYYGYAEFKYDSFEKVWACFWDEQFIIDAITKPVDGERIYDLPKKYLTQKICNVAVAKDSYDFQFVPNEFKTPEMCLLACSMDYGTAIEYVPVKMRTKEMSEASVIRDGKNLKFVPLEFRTVDLCVKAVNKDDNAFDATPYQILAQVAQKCTEIRANEKCLQTATGNIFDKKYAEARKQLDTILVTNVAADDMGLQQHIDNNQALYKTGLAWFLEGNQEKANDFFARATEAAKHISDGYAQYRLTESYHQFQLPATLVSLSDFSQGDFDAMMKDEEDLMKHGLHNDALELLQKAEDMLVQSQCTDMRLWAIVWDHQRFAFYEANQYEECYAVCKKALSKLSTIQLWPYLEEHNAIRHAIRSMNNILAYHCYEEGSSLEKIQEGLKHIAITMDTLAPIEEKKIVYPFYETHAVLLAKAAEFDNKSYQKKFDAILKKITTLKLKEKDFLSEEFVEEFLNK